MARKVKDLTPGDILPLKLPVDTDPSILAFINRKREVSRNKFLLRVFFDGLRNEMKKENPNLCTIHLPLEVNEEQRKQLSNPQVQRALAAFAQTIIGTGSMQPIVIEPKVVYRNENSELILEVEEEDELEFSIYDDLMPPDDEDE